MSDLETIVRAWAEELNSELGGPPSGPGDYFARRVMPKTIVYKTDTEAVTMRMDAEGHYVVERGEIPKPKIRLESTYEIIAESLRTRDPEKLPSGPMKMTMRFWWGARTYDPRVERKKLERRKKRQF